MFGKRWSLWLVLMLSLASAAIGQSTSESLSLTEEEMLLAKKYKIDPQKQYPGSLVIKALLLQITEAQKVDREARQAAWNDGYKAAMVKLYPSMEFQLAINDDLRIQTSQERSHRLFWQIAGVSGIVFGLCVFVLRDFAR